MLGADATHDPRAAQRARPRAVAVARDIARDRASARRRGRGHRQHRDERARRRHDASSPAASNPRDDASRLPRALSGECVRRLRLRSTDAEGEVRSRARRRRRGDAHEVALDVFFPARRRCPREECCARDVRARDERRHGNHRGAKREAALIWRSMTSDFVLVGSSVRESIGRRRGRATLLLAAAPPPSPPPLARYAY